VAHAKIKHSDAAGSSVSPEASLIIGRFHIVRSLIGLNEGADSNWLRIVPTTGIHISPMVITQLHMVALTDIDAAWRDQGCDLCDGSDPHVVKEPVQRDFYFASSNVYLGPEERTGVSHSKITLVAFVRPMDFDEVQI
jgi:hypothetical protein